MPNDINPDEEARMQKLTSDTKELLVRAGGFEITTAEEYQGAGDVLRLIKTKVKDLDELRRGMTRPLDEAKKKIMDLFRPRQDDLANAENLLKADMLDWQREQDRIRDEEEARLREAARKETERLEARAERAAERGKPEQAAVLQEQAEAVPVPVVPGAPKAYGTSTRQSWEAVVTNKTALVAAVAAGAVPEVVLDVNMAVLNQQARALKDQLRYPGVEAVTKDSLVVRNPDARPRELSTPTGRPRNVKE